LLEARTDSEQSESEKTVDIMTPIHNKMNENSDILSVIGQMRNIPRSVPKSAINA
jgi:hypothetical protein